MDPNRWRRKDIADKLWIIKKGKNDSMMNKKKVFQALLIFLITVSISCAAYSSTYNRGQIYLYGEAHSVDSILDEEFQLWSEYYHRDGLRYLFVELPFYSAEFLNLWMETDSDELLNELWKELRGTDSGTSLSKDFYRQIKRECPETIFCGTDVGHQYTTTGERYLKYLREHGQVDSVYYKRAQEVINQGKSFYHKNGMDARAYRENMMVENFVWKFNQLKGESIMGIYGSAHIGNGNKSYSFSVNPNMATQLDEKYPGEIHTEDLAKNYDDFVPCEKDVLVIKGKGYPAWMWGEVPVDIKGKPYNYAKVWELREGSEDFENIPVGEWNILDSSYPCTVGYGKIYILDFYNEDSFGERHLFRSDKKSMEDGSIVTRELIFKE